LSSNPQVDLWAEDEVHFQQHGSRCRMWIPPELLDPVVYHAPTRKSVGYWGAVRLRDGKLVYRRESGKFNGPSCYDFLKQLKASACRSARKVVVIVDNAKYHHAKLHHQWRELHSDCFELLFLPPYSPELNPIEGSGNLLDACVFTTATSLASTTLCTRWSNSSKSGDPQ
jgi:hypothetical protein